MQINTALFAFPFKDEQWQSKALIGGLIGLVGIIFFPVLFVLYGFGLRTMRRTLRGEEPTLPAWDDWEQIITDSLWWIAVTLVYTLPFTLLLCTMVGFMLLAFLLPVMAMTPQSAQEFPTVALMFTFITVWMVLIGIASLVSIPLQFLAQVALTRAVAHNSLNSAFQFKEVWALAREGFSNFLIAFIVYYGILFGISMIAGLLSYTIILACLYPVILGVGIMYTSVLMGALYGRAYRETQEKFATAGVIA